MYIHTYLYVLAISGTKDFPQDHIEDLKLPFDAK